MDGEQILFKSGRLRPWMTSWPSERTPHFNIWIIWYQVEQVMPSTTDLTPELSAGHPDVIFKPQLSLVEESVPLFHNRIRDNWLVHVFTLFFWIGWGRELIAQVDHALIWNPKMNEFMSQSYPFYWYRDGIIHFKTVEVRTSYLRHIHGMDQQYCDTSYEIHLLSVSILCLRY